MTNIPGKRIVTIGQGRRLTLSELYAISTQRATLSWIEPLETANQNDEVAVEPPDPDALVTLLKGVLNVGYDATESEKQDYLTIIEAKAFVTLLAFQVAHLQGNQSRIARLFAQIANLATGTPTQPTAAAAAAAGPSSCLSRIHRASTAETVLKIITAGLALNETESSSILLTPSLIQRCASTSGVAVAVYVATQLATCALPVAALTVDSTGHTAAALGVAGGTAGGTAGGSGSPWYAEEAFEKRPHRSMIRAAATLRAILHESRHSVSTTDTATSLTMLAALRDIPQYHGPTMEQLTTAATQLELELNSQPVSAETAFDLTLLESVLQTAESAVSIQWTKSRERQGLTATPTTELSSLSWLVAAWNETLSQEAATALERIRAATPSAAPTSNNDAPPAAAVGRPTGGSGVEPDDEFAGMSEAQVTKILRIRAEKEAKAAAKRQAKEAKGASLFGTGTHILSDMLHPFVNGSTVQFVPVPVFEEGNTNSSAVMAASAESLVHQWTNAIETLLSGGVQRKPKIPKGTRDYLPEQMMIRQQAFDIIRRVFAAHGAVEIDTPVFELKETLTGKYGEDSKLIYDLADQGGELLALRYDLTVPFARFLALNNVGHIKRYHIGKVYRRDQPALKRGRYREFYQCDFDIAGSFGRMVPDSECLCVVCEILDALPIGDFAIKVNHRCLLDAILDLCGVPAEKFRTICSAVDKLDKEPWEEVKREMVDDKGLQEGVADKIGEFVLNKGQPLELYKQLIDAKRFGDHKGAGQAMEDLRILFEYLEVFDKLKFISFDLSLARGLDYYTGVIYEAVCISGNSQVGSIGGGGRYDNLVSMFQGAGKQTPCVGVSVGIERVFTLMEARLREEKGGSIKQPNVSVLIAAAGSGMMKEKMNIARMLWDAKISAEFNQQEKSKLSKEVVDALDREIPYMVVIGETELAENKCQVKDIKALTADLVPLPDLVAYLRNKGVIPVGCEFAAEQLMLDLPK